MIRSLNLTRLTAAALVFFAAFTLFACNKDKSETQNAQDEEQASVATSEADAEAEVVFNGVFDDVMGVNNDVGIAGTGVFGGRVASGELSPMRTDSLARCFTVTITRPTANPFPVRVVVDFGTSGCLGRDGHTRYGKVITEYTNRLLIPGAIAVTTFDGYRVDSISVQGTHKIQNTTNPLNVQQVRQFTVDVTNAKLSKPNGNFTEWNSHKVMTQLEGLFSALPIDDIFKLEGYANGRVRRGALIVIWRTEITEPLIKKFACPWISKGIIRVFRGTNADPNNPWTASLNYGAGTCDNKALLTVNGVTREITLH